MLLRRAISRPLKWLTNYPLKYEPLKAGCESLRHSSGITRTGRIGPRSGYIKSRLRLSRNSLAGTIAARRSHLLHKQFPVRTDRLFHKSSPRSPAFAERREDYRELVEHWLMEFFDTDTADLSLGPRVLSAE